MTREQEHIWTKATSIMSFCRSFKDSDWATPNDKDTIIRHCLDIRWAILDQKKCDVPELMRNVNRLLKKNFSTL